MRLILSFLLLTSVCLAEDLTLEERVTSLENKMSNLGSYVEENCHLVYDFAGSSTMGCFDSFVSNVRTDVRVVGPNLFVTNWVDCRRYRLVCR